MVEILFIQMSSSLKKKSLDNRLPQVKQWLMVVVLKLNQRALLLKMLIIQEIVQEEIQVSEEIGEAKEDVIKGHVATSVVEQQVEVTIDEVTTGNVVISMTNQKGQAQTTSLSILMDLMVNHTVVLVVIK